MSPDAFDDALREAGAEVRAALESALYVPRLAEDVSPLLAAGLTAAHPSAPMQLQAGLVGREAVVLVDQLGSDARNHIIEIAPHLAIYDCGLPPGMHSVTTMLGFDPIPLSEWDNANTITARTIWLDWVDNHFVTSASPTDHGGAFPVAALPPALGAIVLEGAVAQGVDPAFYAVPLLGVLAGCIGASRSILVRPNWPEPSILWCVVIGPSGCGKSPPLDLLLAPVREHDAELQRRTKAAFDRHRALQASLGRKRSQRTELAIQEPEEPLQLSAIVDDVTMEALASLLRDNPRGLLLATDEAATWFGSFNAYRGGRGADEAKWLAIFGARPLKVDRKGGGTIYVPKPHVSVIGGTQPRVIARLLGRQHRESGLAARILFAAPRVTAATWTDRSIAAETTRAYRHVVESLLALGGAGGVEALPLSAAARRLFQVEYDRLGAAGHAAAKAGSDDLSAVHAKLGSLVPRVALVLGLAAAAEAGSAHLLREVDEVAMAGAIQIGAYFAGQAAALYGRLQAEDGSALSARILGIIRRAGAAGATRTEIRDGLGRNAVGDEIDAVLRSLRDQGLIARVEAPPGGVGRPVERWQCV
jgi:hypothetical protein